MRHEEYLKRHFFDRYFAVMVGALNAGCTSEEVKEIVEESGGLDDEDMKLMLGAATIAARLPRGD